MIQLTVEENRSYEEQEVCHICQKKFCTDEHDENYKNKKKGYRSLSLHRKI